MDAGIRTRRSWKMRMPKKGHLAFLSIVEPKKFEEANHDKHWIKAMEEELDQIENNKTWKLVPRPRE